MCNGHWNIMSQISVPSKTISSESISDMSETKGLHGQKVCKIGSTVLPSDDLQHTSTF